MKLPSLDTFALPISPSHVAVTAGIILTQLIPGLGAEPRGYITGGIVLGYCMVEGVFSSIKAKKVVLPQISSAEAVEFERRITELERKP